MNSAQITKELHVHKKQTRAVMSYTDEAGTRVAKVIDMKDHRNSEFIFRTLRWASYRGIEVTFRPV